MAVDLGVEQAVAVVVVAHDDAHALAARAVRPPVVEASHEDVAVDARAVFGPLADLVAAAGVFLGWRRFAHVDGQALGIVGVSALAALTHAVGKFEKAGRRAETEARGQKDRCRRGGVHRGVHGGRRLFKIDARDCFDAERAARQLPRALPDSAIKSMDFNRMNTPAI